MSKCVSTPRDGSVCVCHADNASDLCVCRIAFMNFIARPDTNIHTHSNNTQKTVLIRSAHVLWLPLLLRNVTLYMLYMLLHACIIRARATRHCRRDATRQHWPNRCFRWSVAGRAYVLYIKCDTHHVQRSVLFIRTQAHIHEHTRTHKSHQVWVIKILSRAWRTAGTRVLGPACCCG